MSEATRRDPITIEVELAQGLSIVRIAGELDLETEPALHQALDGAGLDDASSVELHLDELTFIDSSGLRCLVLWAQRLERLVLVDPTPPVERVLAISGLDHVLAIRRGSTQVDPTVAAAGG
jgi:anti-sigma B factor antagonist